MPDPSHPSRTVAPRGMGWRFLLHALIAVLAGLAVPCPAADPETVFDHPPDLAKPRVMWMWMGCNVTTNGITKDLEALKDAGFGGAMMFALADICTPWASAIGNSPTPRLLAFTDPWWKMVRHAASESKRLGLDFGIGNCPGYETSGGPWVTPELSMQEIVWSKTPVTGGGSRPVTLPRPTVDSRANQMFPVYNPKTGELAKPVVEARTTFYRDIAVLAVPDGATAPSNPIVDLTGKMGADGRLSWSAPAGAWTILRFGYTTKGKLVQPAQWEAQGLECDKMNPDAVRAHLDHVLGDIKKHLGDLVGPGLSNLHFDSYEAGEPSWTPRMREEFKARRGYDLVPWLPALAGCVVESKEQSAKFRADFKLTISDLYRDVYYPTLKRLVNAAGLELSSEPYGGPWKIREIVPQLDRVLTEFWTTGDAFKPYNPRLEPDAWSAGKNLIEAEAFTGAPGFSRWDETPARIKRIGDSAFCAGVNRMMLHHFAHQPWPGVQPGITMGQWGTHFSQNQTWWEPGKAWVAYLARAHALLQWGAIVPTALGDFDAATPQPGTLRAIHRRGPEGDIYFVANTTMEPVSAACAFSVAGKQPELWDPVRGTKRVLTQFRQDNGRTTIPLEFAPAESLFIVFRKPAPATPDPAPLANFPTHERAAEIGGPWRVTFEVRPGAPTRPVEFATLQDWTENADPAIRYFSGTASYARRFDVPSGALTNTLELDLGKVHHLARVRLNGRDLGVAWTAPWRVAVPAGLLREKDNELIIEITNVWANRLIGDEQEPDDCEWTPGPRGNGRFLKAFPDWFVKKQPRPSRGRHTFTTWNYFTKDSKLTPSGLIGPVQLVAQSWPVAAEMPAVAASISTATGASFEEQLATTNLARIASVEEKGVANAGGGTNADALFNGTTRNGSGAEATLNDGRTYRGYGAGSGLTLGFAEPVNLDSIRTFAAHDDARGSQHYSVYARQAGADGKERHLGTVRVDVARQASIARVAATLTNVVALRFEFADGPAGFNVYREICIITTGDQP